MTITWDNSPIDFRNQSDQFVIEEAIKRIERSAKKSDVMIACPADAKRYFQCQLGDKDREHFVMTMLDVQNRLIATECLFKGTLTQTSVYPREVVRTSLKYNAASVIFAHNHPSGYANPSNADKSLTKHLAEALALVDVRVIDHFVVTATEVLSMAEMGAMQ